MFTNLSTASTLFSSSSRWFTGVVRGSIDIDPLSRTSDTYLPWQTNGAYGGICATHYFHDIPQRAHTPVIFVHGNSGDATDWLPMMESFLDGEYTGEDLWALTFKQPSPTHSEMATQLDTFVQRVREFTGHDTVKLVSHSLGVTGVRYWLDRYERHSWVTKFVGLAGANHGSSRCKLLDRARPLFSATDTTWFLNPDYLDDQDHPLARLNADETPGDIEYYTLRASDDRFFRENPKSPELEGAENRVIEGNHLALLDAQDAVDTVYGWLQG